jgi:SPP1 family predicted phage head-tail adaptor
MLAFKPAMMRHRIAIQENTKTQDSNGVLSNSWADVSGMSSVPAEFRFLSGSERIASAQTHADYKARITIYKVYISEDMRISFDGKLYDIIDILPDPTNEVYLNIMVRKYSG